MSHLALSLLGAFQATLDGAPIFFSSVKARALLAYLAVESGRPHPREMLAALLWPEEPEAVTHSNFRHTLSALRKAIGDRDEVENSVLLVTRETVQLNCTSDCWLDVRAFQEGVKNASSDSQLVEAVALYRGDFLEGFYVKESVAFEDWVSLVRDRLQRQATTALQHLVEISENQGDYAQACAYAWRWIELEPWQEDAYQHLMRALALHGQRTTALAQYDVCRDVLQEEFGVEPSAQTLRLYERIRDGEIHPPIQPTSGTQVAPLLPVSPAPMLPSASTPLPALESERRVVTLLLADVNGPAMLLQRRHTEAWAEFITPALHLLGAEVARFGGNVEQYRCAGLTASFGGQVAHEDDPERAVLAALAMQEALPPYLTKNDAADLCLTISVHTGELIFAAIGDTVSLTGDVFDNAERIQVALEPGAIWVSPETHRLVAPLFTWTPRDRAGYQPLAHRLHVDKGRGIAGLSSPLVGREAELRALQEAVERLQAGIGGIVTLIGEAGIGKSRLVAELKRSAVSQQPSTGLVWVEGRCLSYATGAVYQVWHDMLHTWLDAASDATPDAVANTLRQRVYAVCPEVFNNVYPFLAWLLSLPLDAVATARLRGIEAEGLQVLTFRAVETLLDYVTRRNPLIVVCEDLHWADATSLALLEHLLALTDRAPLLFVCIFRPERDHGCWHIREVAARTFEHRHIDVCLKALSEMESMQLVNNLLAMDGLPQELRAYILERGEGNPFYVEEIVRSLIDGGIIAYDETVDQWAMTREMDAHTLPNTLYGVLMARIDRLPVGAKRVLQLASVIGRLFSYPLLAAIAERDTLDDHLVSLQRAQMIRERTRVPERDFIFHHQFILEATYDGLLHRARRVLHRRVAEAMEGLYPERIEEGLGLLAYHWEQAGDVEQARRYLCRAAEQAAAQFANAEAADYLARALVLTPETLPAKRYDLLLDLERLHDLQSLREPQLNDLNKLHELAEALDDGTPTGAIRLGEVYQRRAHYLYLLGEFDEAIAASRQTIQLGKIARSVRHEAYGHLIWAQVLRVHNAQIEGAETHLAEAIALARAEHLDDVEAPALVEMGLLYGFFLNKFDQARSYLKRCLTLYQNLGDRVGEAKAQGNIGSTYLWEGDFVTARDYQMRALRLHYEQGNVHGQGWVLEFLGEATVGLGYYAEGLTYLQQSRNILKRIGEAFGEGYVLSCLTRTYLVLGRYEEAELCSKRQLQIGQDIDDSGFRVVSNYWRSEIMFCRGNPGAALEFGQQAYTERQKRSSWQEFRSLLVIGQALVALGNLEEATRTYEQASEISNKLARQASALVGLADIYTRQGQITEALKYVDEVLDKIDIASLINQTLYPAGIYLTCYQVLKAAQDERSAVVLEQAHTLLQELAARIEDEALKRSFLENVPVHREIVAEFEKTQQEK